MLATSWVVLLLVDVNSRVPVEVSTLLQEYLPPGIFRLITPFIVEPVANK